MNIFYKKRAMPIQDILPDITDSHKFNISIFHQNVYYVCYYYASKYESSIRKIDSYTHQTCGHGLQSFIDSIGFIIYFKICPCIKYEIITLFVEYTNLNKALYERNIIKEIQDYLFLE